MKMEVVGMTIEKVGKKWRITEMRNGIRYRVSVDEKPTKREAADLIGEKIGTADPTGTTKDTFEESARKYMLVKENVLSPSTKRSYNSIIKALSDNFKRTKTAAITQELIQKEISDYSATHSAKSVHNVHSLISAILGLYRPSLKISTTLPQKAVYERHTPSQGEVEMVLDAVAGSRYELPYRLGCYGLRRSEVCATATEDLDGNILHIHRAYVQGADGVWLIKDYGKNAQSNRRIYVDDKVAALIREKQGRCFDGHPNRLNDHLRETTKRLGIPRFRFHDFRSYYASMAHALGVPDIYIQANGGWKSNYTLNKIYKNEIIDVAAEMNKKIADFLG
jgi:integrase